MGHRPLRHTSDIDFQIDDNRRRIEMLERRVLRGGHAIYAIEVFEIEDPVVVGEPFEWQIPEDLENSVLVKIEGYVTNPSSSGNIQVQIRKEPETGPDADMLSTPLTIDAGELNSKNATTQPVIDTNEDDVDWGDHLVVVVEAEGTDATGLGLILYFFPADLARIVLRGAQGPAGGVTSWTGTWVDATTYNEGDVVYNNGTTYVAIVDHTASAASEPGVGANWEDFWMILIEGNASSAIQCVVNGNGFVIDTGIKAYVEVPFDCTLYEVVMLADVAGSIVVDIWKDTYANHPPTNADSITSASPPTISAAIKSVDSVLSGWTTALSQGDILAFNVDSCTGITKITVSLKVLR